MPSISEILDSVSVNSLIKDEVIRNGEFEKTTRGFIYYSGGFTVVFPVVAGRQKWAFRCWHTEMGNVRDRFKIISDYINELKSPYFCNFYYCDNGLVVDGKLFPTTRMKWVNGEPINQYILRHKDNKTKLLSLASKFLSMTDFLHKHHIAHGDLQHGNIIIENDEIKLVDYDSIFVPELEGSNDIIIGKAEFQHPNRSELKIASDKLDYFSELVVYLSIIAIANQPSLTNEYSIEDSLLFQSGDWRNFSNSRIFKSLNDINNDDITILTSILSSFLEEKDINNLRPFQEVWKEFLKKPEIKSFVCGNVGGIVFRNLETQISWEIENFTSILVNDKIIPQGQMNCFMTFSDDTEITLIVKNGLHIAEQRKQIKVVDAPEISFNANKKKLKKTGHGVEPLLLNWQVKNVASVSILCNGEVISTATSSNKFVTNPTDDSKYELVAVGLDNKTEFSSQINIHVCEPAKIEFKSDKMFTLPGVPITLSWNVHKATNVKINNTEVGLKGHLIFTPTKDERYTLTCKDDFGDSTTELTIKMLPLPIIKSILVKTPIINNPVGIHYSTPQFIKMPNIPIVESIFANLTIPKIPTLKESGIFVKSPEKPRIKLTHKVSTFLKSIFK